VAAVDDRVVSVDDKVRAVDDKVAVLIDGAQTVQRTVNKVDQMKRPSSPEGNQS